ncbi:hypothetical protein G5714_024573 [Onychostoma macrolepis]|uniref:Uncharacterized protein n=1 Tax=Onychostoma macrolepis TaxID=369639 RepID=A0A7J6BLV7_9TELE|nr:hypothetical protein G5714_024573 [Onychostoma macrolepis]
MALRTGRPRRVDRYPRPIRAPRRCGIVTPRRDSDLEALSHNPTDGRAWDHVGPGLDSRSVNPPGLASCLTGFPGLCEPDPRNHDSGPRGHRTPSARLREPDAAEGPPHAPLRHWFPRIDLGFGRLSLGLPGFPGLCEPDPRNHDSGPRGHRTPSARLREPDAAEGPPHAPLRHWFPRIDLGFGRLSLGLPGFPGLCEPDPRNHDSGPRGHRTPSARLREPDAAEGPPHAPLRHWFPRIDLGFGRLSLGLPGFPGLCEPDPRNHDSGPRGHRTPSARLREPDAAEGPPHAPLRHWFPRIDLGFGRLPRTSRVPGTLRARPTEPRLRPEGAPHTLRPPQGTRRRRGAASRTPPPLVPPHRLRFFPPPSACHWYPGTPQGVEPRPPGGPPRPTKDWIEGRLSMDRSECASREGRRCSPPPVQSRMALRTGRPRRVDRLSQANQSPAALRYRHAQAGF